MTNSGQARQAARLLYRNPKKIRNKVGFLWDKYIPCLACPKTTKTGRFSMVQIGNFLSYHDNITNMRHIMNRTEICKRCGKSKADDGGRYCKPCRAAGFDELLKLAGEIRAAKTGRI